MLSIAAKARLGSVLSKWPDPTLYNQAAGKGLVLTPQEVAHPPTAFANLAGVKKCLSGNNLPPRGCVVIFIRHPATAESETGQLVGQKDVDISAKGKGQIPVVAQALADIPFTALYSSPLLRCSALAARIASLQNLTPQVLPDLQEINYGVWVEKTLTTRKGGSESIEQTDPDGFRIFNEQPHLWQVEGSETFGNLQTRVCGAVSQIVAQHPGQVVGIVGHGWAINTAFTGFLGVHLAHLKQVPLGAPTAVSAISFFQGSVSELWLWANSDHLLPEDRSTRVYFT